MNPARFVYDTWFDVAGIRDAKTWRAYLNADREITGGIREHGLESYDWRKRVVIEFADLIEPTRLWSAGR